MAYVSMRVFLAQTTNPPTTGGGHQLSPGSGNSPTKETRT
jgi:hypothetical protein